MERGLIFDVGMHTGEDTGFYLAKGFRVVAVDADPVLCAQVRERFSSCIRSGQLEVVEGAIAETAGPLPFYLNARTEWSTIRRSWAERNERLGFPSKERQVEGIRFRSLLGRYGTPYYMKIDIEGADLLCLEALVGRGEVPQFVSVESEKRSWRGLRQEFDVLREIGYNGFKVVAQHRITEQSCPDPAREGNFVPFSFPPGSSGLFGEELPGAWLTREEALRRYMRIFAQYRLLGDYGWISGLKFARSLCARAGVGAGWYDTHATAL